MGGFPETKIECSRMIVTIPYYPSGSACLPRQFTVLSQMPKNRFEAKQASPSTRLT